MDFEYANSGEHYPPQTIITINSALLVFGILLFASCIALLITHIEYLSCYIFLSTT